MVSRTQAILLWVAMLTGVAQASVVRLLSPECRKFLYLGIAPTGLERRSLHNICQRFNMKARYVTLYDTVGHIPVYSAYTFQRSEGQSHVDVPWMYEPQLSLVSETDEMQPFPRSYTPMNLEDAQAVLEDYTNAILYKRGPLNPNAHQAEPDDKAATYTLTNVVPQRWEFSVQAWEPQEQVIRKRLNNYCHGTAYVVTGVITSGRMIRRHNINRLAVPEYMWSAYCCIDYDRNAPFNERYKFPVYGHYGLNDKGDSEVVELSIQKLEDFIKKMTFVEKNFQIFSEGCVAPSVQMATK